MPEKVLCCFPLETKVRDLDGRLYLGLKCLREGFDCLIGWKNGVHRHMFTTGMPFLYFDKGLDATAPEFYRRIKARGGAVVSLDEEGGVYNKRLFEQELLRRFNPGVVCYVDLVLAWGAQQRDALVRSGRLPAEKIVATGHPRFDLCKPSFADFQRRLRQGVFDVPTKYILVNSTFSAANTHLSFEEEIALRRKMRGDDTIDEHYERLLYCYRKLLIHYFHQAIRAMRERFPDLAIVFRPHPGENAATYRELFAELDQVFVSGEGAALQWIVDAELVLHHDCTTAVEAFLHQKRVISYSRILDHYFVQEVPVRIGELTADQGDLLDRIADTLAGRAPLAARLAEGIEIIRPIVANVDFDAADRIVGQLLKLVSSKPFTRTVDSTPPAADAPDMLTRIAGKARALGGRLGGRSEKLTERARTKFTGLSREEIEVRIRQLCARDPALPRVRVEEVEPDVFLLTR